MRLSRSSSAESTTAFLGLGSGVGLVVANMVGAGVFLSAGFMAQELSAAWILLAWLVGALLAMAGARAYAEAALLIPRSGGEYRYLSELMHPVVGYLAGWASLLVGFSAPTAISAYAAAAFAFAVVGEGDPRIGATLLIVALALLHASALRTSRRGQNVLVIAKVILIVAFVGLGLALGDNHWPTWVPPTAEVHLPVSFATALFFVAYAFSGWNSVAYVSEELERPRRNVPAAMLIGCALVGTMYLLLNWILVANLTPERAEVVFEYEQARVTLAHLVAEQFLGAAGSSIASIGIAAIMVSSASAMMLVGPRVYAEMARDGFLPSVLEGSAGAPPRASVLLQALIAIALLYLNTVAELLSNVAGVLVLFSGLVALSLFFVKSKRPELPAPRGGALLAAAVYAASSAWMLYQAFTTRTGLILWLAVAFGAGVLGYLFSRRRPS